MANYKIYAVTGLTVLGVIFVYFSSTQLHFFNIGQYYWISNNRVWPVNEVVTQTHNCSHNHLMLSVLRKGRLGNAMWQYSALLGLANMTDRTPILNHQFRDLARMFRISVPLETRSQRLENYSPYDLEVPYDVEATADNLRNITDDIMLRGYFQYFRFFAPVSDQIRKEFTFRKGIQRKVYSFFNRHKPTDRDVVKIGIHVRRRDLTRPSWIKKGFGPPPVSYFRNAMKYFRKKYKSVHFFLCSDDLGWARKHIPGRDVTFVEHQPPEVDMAIMASCDHVIIGNGTFSWWVGWLCTGTTVRYKQMPKRNTTLYAMTSGEYWPLDDAYNHYVSIDS